MSPFSSLCAYILKINCARSNGDGDQTASVRIPTRKLLDFTAGDQLRPTRCIVNMVDSQLLHCILLLGLDINLQFLIPHVNIVWLAFYFSALKPLPLDSGIESEPIQQRAVQKFEQSIEKTEATKFARNRLCWIVDSSKIYFTYVNISLKFKFWNQIFNA